MNTETLLAAAEPLIQLALAEDIGPGDATSLSTLDAGVDLNCHAGLCTGHGVPGDQHERGMVVVVTCLQFIVDVDLAPVAAVDLHADGLSRRGLTIDRSRDGYFTDQPAGLVVLGPLLARAYRPGVGGNLRG